MECLCSPVLARIGRPEQVFPGSHWKATLVLLAAYAGTGFVAGGLFGALCGAGVRRSSPGDASHSWRIVRTLATLTVVAAFSINLIIGFPSRLLAPAALGVSLLLGCLLVMSVASTRWSRSLRVLANPWIVCPLLLGLPWLSKDVLYYRSTTTKAVAVIAYFIVVLGVGSAAQRLRERLPGPRRAFVSPMGNLLMLTPPVCLFMIFIAFWDRFPTPKIPDLRTPAPAAGRPHVVLVVMDTVRADHLSVYGYEKDTAPNIRRLAEQSTVYSHAVAPADLTLPSHASLFTGRYPSWHGARMDVKGGHPWGRPLSEDTETLAEILSRAGYVTAGVVANYGQLNRNYLMNQGFYYYSARTASPLLQLASQYYLRAGVRDILGKFARTSDLDLHYRRAEDINDEVFAALRQLSEADRPLLLFVNYMDAHFPYVPPPPFDTMYPGRDGSFSYRRYRELYDEVMSLEREITGRERRHLVSQYDGAIAYIDFCIGRLIARLKKYGLYENCLLIITSDHGEAFGRRNLIDHGVVSLYQDQVHVPLIVKYPHSRAGVVVRDTVSLVDILPTTLDVLGEKAPAGVQGASLLKRRPDEDRYILSESSPGLKLVELHRRFDCEARSIFFKRWKLISWTTGKKRLYDFVNDPNEEEDKYKPGDPLSRELSGTLDQMLKTARRPAAPPTKINKETLDRLRSLGYVQ